MSKTYERVHFRLLQMPCCSHLFCNVNPRLPSFCPACGSPVYAEIRGCVLISDDKASLTYDSAAGAPRPAPAAG